MDTQPVNKRPLNEPIAIIGSGCRFPGSLNAPSKLWEFLRNPKDLLTKIPSDRFNADAFFHPDGNHHGTSNVTHSYFLQDDPRLFDAAFFNMKPVEAHSVDPQHRLLLEVVYESLEAAGQPIESLVGTQTGCYVGLMCADFSEHLQRDLDSIPAYMATGTARSLISNRISYFFDWRGPSMTIDTACSSSLFAVHQAVQLLRSSSDTSVAIAAGSNLIFGPELYVGESKLKMLSPTGRSRMWDADADGYARGEGVAAVVLKRLSDAIRDGDHIESVIRESFVNSDGRTKGLTMPNELAQADLITRTYNKAGLDPRKESDRCQFFEAHGTGTEAGDCREAEGISRAFFGYGGNDYESSSNGQDSNLYVGSVKTVIGHTEGTAGLAGLLKASLALQHSTIPPNMLFNKLSPKVAPFYKGVEITTAAKPWPKVEGPRRSSVNSFGFGGSNAHVILENYAAATPLPSASTSVEDVTSFPPFVFSAGSESALRGILEQFSQALPDQAKSTDPRDLSYTLNSRRSTLGVRTTFPAGSIQSLITNINAHLQEAGSSNTVTRPSAAVPRILGVFTGQGAQWAAMGRSLIQGSSFVRKRIEDLQSVLSGLVHSDRPSWSLTDELLADAELSRLGEARLSQPLCTVVQIVLVDLLRAAGVEFSSVVGHSSGEIAAAYAAGIINAEEALKLAYYRGLCTEEYITRKGAMLAVGTSFEDATEICELDAFAGRISVAAVNSPSSVTLSGDADAVQEAKELFDDEKKFARVLKVNKAYHSHHMEECSAQYLDALLKCNIQPREPRNGCKWYSSVYEGKQIGKNQTDFTSLKGEYWRDNMLRPVLFAQAVEAAVNGNAEAPFNTVVEVGPHPALKGPTLETLAVFHDNILKDQPTPTPYTGTLQRGKDDIGALSLTLGFLWSRFSKPVVDFSRYDALLSGESNLKSLPRRLVPNLPSYKWDHDRVFWHESRLSRAMRNRNSAFHPLLGRRVTDGVTEELRWRNMIKPAELPWIRGHQLQGQMVYPAAAYLSTAIESCTALADGAAIRDIEIRDFVIGKALVFDTNTDQSGVESLFTLSDVSKRADKKQIEATFRFHASPNPDSDTLSCLATGRILVRVASDDDTELDHSSRLKRATESPADTAEVGEDQFYSSLEKLGYEYTQEFRALSGMKRKLNYGSAYVRVPGFEQPVDAVLIHPAVLDCALQAIFLAYWWPNDGSLDQLHVPTHVASIRINSSLCAQDLTPGVQLPLESFLTENPLITNIIGGDVDVYGRDEQTPLIQIEGVRVTPLAKRTPQADRQLFREHVWGPMLPDGALAQNNRATPEDFELALDLERISIYFMKKLDQDIPLAERHGLEWHHEALFDFITHVLTQTAAGRQRFGKPEWLQDTWDQISAIIDKYPNSIEVKLNRTVGENLAASVKGETQILQHMFKDNLLNRYYTEAMGLRETTLLLGGVVAQLAHRYPNMDILEIGAGTGGATKAIFAEIGRAFGSYTFTDISTGFMEKAQEVFAATADKMVFKALDIEKDVVDQGYTEHSYDLIVASLVLHATKSLEKTMEETRRLLKPGGYLVLLEISNNDVLRVGFAMSGLPGWWLGREDGRKYSPCVGSAKWHEVFLKTGFSGIDTITPEIDTLARPVSVIVTQAVDQHVNLLREPLLYPEASNAGAADKGDLVVIGGGGLSTVVLIDNILRLTRNFGFNIIRVPSPEHIDAAAIPPTALVLNVSELDKPIFQDLTRETMKGLQALVDYQRTILWVTQGCRADEPYANMSVGLGRTLVLEAPEVRLQFLDLDFDRKHDAELVVETLLRLRFTRDNETSIRQGQMLYSLEQEVVQENDRVLVPRLLPIQPANDRYNASKRIITETKSPKDRSLVLTKSDQGYLVNEAEDHHLTASEVLIHVSKCTLTPVVEKLYGVVGQQDGTRDWVLALSYGNGSRVAVQKDHLLQVGPACTTTNAQESLLASLVIEAQCDQVLLSAPSGSKIIVDEPSGGLRRRLIERAIQKHLNIVFTAPVGDDTNRDLGDLPDGFSVVPLSPLAPRRAVLNALPSNPSAFVDCSNNIVAAGGLGALIASCVPDGCQSTTLQDLMLRHYPRSTPEFGLLETLKRAAEHTNVSSGFRTLSPTAVTATSLTELLDTSDTIIVDWKAESKIPVKLQSVDALIKFDANKTYVLFGLTSDLALSLVDWMGAHGAKTVILTSRHPAIDPRWLDHCRSKGMRVEAFANDITDRSAVEKLVDDIRRTFPPIAGIMHGAMVLQDTPFASMPFETMEKVLRPKVLGTIHLDRLFQDDTLDFLVFFSSLASASGNRGQSNYSASNMYMTTKTLERRRKGLAASVLHIGAVMGVGYVMREASEIVFPAIRRAGFQWMDERAFHQAIAEAILAGRPGSGRNPEIVTGLRVINVDEEEPAPWMDNPRFAHCLVRSGNANADGKNRGGNRAKVAVKTRLLEVTTPEEIHQTITEAFLQKLQIMLQIQLESDADRTNILSATAEDTGIDSLVAVEIRAWFQKEMDIDVPVLKILGGATVTDLISFAHEKLSATLTPKLGSTGTSSSASAEVTTAAKAPTTPVISSTGTVSATLGSELGSSSPSDNQKSVRSGASTPSFTSARAITPPFSEDDIHEVEAKIASPPRREHNMEVEKKVPMSLGQSRFWFLRQYIEDQTTFNVTFSVRLRGHLDVPKFKRAIEALGDRHEALRTAFPQEPSDSAPLQAILKKSLLQVEESQIRNESEASAAFEAMKNHVFDIQRGESMRVQLLRLNPVESVLVVAYHHINMDGASLEVFMDDLGKLYSGRSLTPNPYQYSSFSVQQHRDVQAGAMNSELAYWKTQLADAPAALPLLPFSGKSTRTPIHRYDYNRVDRRLDDSITRRIREVCRRNKISLFHFYLGVFEVTLSRLLDTTDLCIGMADANRFEGELSTSMGMYLNLLPLRFRLSGNQSFQDVLKETRCTAYGAMAHSRVPFDLILENLKVPRSTLHSPLFQAFINYRGGVAEKRSFGGLDGEGEEYHFGRAAYDITLDIMDNPSSNPLVMFVVQKQLYSTEDADLVASEYIRLLDYFSRNLSSTIETVPAFNERSVEEAIKLGTGQVIESKWPGGTVVHRIDEMIRSHPEAIAIKDPLGGGGTWTYRQLGNRTASVARFLLESGIVRGARVVLFQEPGLDWVCSVLAVMRIGAAFVPLDASTPSAHLATITDALKPAGVLIHDATASHELIGDLSSMVSNIKNVSAIVDSTPGEVPIEAEVKGTAMILFTSGTTGTPKGVLLSHEGLANFFIDPRVEASDVVLQHSALGFDLAMCQSLQALLHGATLVVAPRSVRGDPVAITSLILDEGVTWAGATPSEYLSWIQYGFSKLSQCTAWRHALTVGEQVPLRLLQDFQKLQLPDLRLWNAYGPSEITLGSNITGLSIQGKPGANSDQRISVGSTMANRAVYILDESDQPVSLGMPGEVVIGGVGVSSGYLNNPTLTREKFVPNPFATDRFRSQGWSTMFKTGDRGRLNKNGDLELFGRIDGDSQIKLRGIRIELEDIEQAIIQASNNALSVACVTPRGKLDATALVAHSVFRPGCSVEEKDRVSFLQRLTNSLPLPQYMRPAAIIPIDLMPLTAHGKLDRRAVQQLPVHVTATHKEGASTGGTQLSDQESRVSRLWQQVLPSDVLTLHKIERDSDFFNVGGTSMLIVKLQDLIKQDFGVTLPIIRLFENSTLRAMATLVHDAAVAASDDAIIWEEEISLSKTLVDTVPLTKTGAKSQTGGRTVILTGATGFVGSEILSRLIASPDVSSIHCIAVREPSKLLESASPSRKVTIHQGDLTSLEDSLGTLENIFASSHAIIHCGADVSFLKTFATLRKPNVTATKELARLALKHGLDFHYISTAATGRLLLPDPLAGLNTLDGEKKLPSVPQTAAKPIFREESVAAYPPPPTWPDGYVASKWASEAFLERAAERLGLKVWIHRPTSVTGVGAGETDVVSSVVRFAKKLRAVPVSGRWEGSLDFVSVESVGAGVVDIVVAGSIDDDSAATKRTTFVHHSGDVIIPIEGLRKHLENEDGYEYREIGLGDWVEMAVAEGMNLLVAAYLAAVDEMDLDITFQSFVKG
ncbi:hypothetical protein QBC43DRAFT_353361 [Cladorrhinum sp. PSN259]|nr:hypothetical protein QBC43DRAFT_353361 [Cladorrhinum sp. PSN259]